MDFSAFGYDREAEYLKVHEGKMDRMYEWILSQFSGHFKKPVVEVGSGRGTVTKHLACIIKDRSGLLCIEPEYSLYEFLRRKHETLGVDRNLIKHGTTLSLYKEIMQFKPQTFVYINVLEHIENDLQELKRIHGLLQFEGKILIFVPALEQLYSKRDIRAGHYRRYYKIELERKLKIAGFRILKLRYFDLIGAFLWWGKFVLLNSDNIGTGNVGFYNSFVPLIGRFIENKISPPFGKNLVAIAETDTESH